MADSLHGESQRLFLLSAAGAEHEGSPAIPDLWQQVERHFVENRDHLYFYLLACGAPPVDADDLTQDAFVRLYRYMRAGKRVERLRPWLCRIARNLLLDQRKGLRYESPAASENEWLHWQDALADPRVDLEAAALRQERRAGLERAFQALTPLQIQYLHLRADGLRHREIAEIYGVAVSSVVDAVRRALERLGKEME